jgi:hypothetical protein
MEKPEIVSNIPEKENKLAMIPEDFNALSVEEAFKHKHVVFEVNECFENTKINLFNDFISSYTKSYRSGPEEQKEVKQKMENNIYVIRFDPAFFLLWNTDDNALAGYIPELKTLFLPDMKTYKNPEIYTHEVTHSIGSICVNSEGLKIEDYEIYNALNEGITEKMTVEMICKKKEGYSPNVKCAQVIDVITGGKANEGFLKNDVGLIKEAYDKEISEGAFEDLVFNTHGIENTFKEINKYRNEIFDFEDKNDVNSAEFIKNYDAIKQLIDNEDNARLIYKENKTEENKEKYSTEMNKTDEELKKFKDEIVNYVLAKEYVKKYDNGGNIDLICERMANSFDRHLSILINKSNTQEEQRKIMQKFCNIQASFDFSENKIPVLENVIKTSIIKLYEKMTNTTLTKNINIYEKLGIQHNLNWLNNATEDNAKF